MSAKLDKLRLELEKARKRKADWDNKVKELERRYKEEENGEIQEMVHAANLNTDQLAELLRMFATEIVPKPETIKTIVEEENTDEV